MNTEKDSVPENLVTNVPPDDTIAIIIPLFGYWNDLGISELNLDVLKYTLARLNSYFNKVYFIFPCEPGRMEADIKNYLAVKQLGGNSTGVQVEQYATYSEYVNEGIAFALEETDAKFFVIANPWIALRNGAIDTLVDLLNRPDVAVCSGYDLRKDEISDAEIDTHEFNPPKEFTALDINLFGMSRAIAEAMKLDSSYKTTSFLSRDFFEELTSKRYPVLMTQNVVFYSFPVTWADIEDPGDFLEDRQKFLDKWKFDPGIKEEER